MFNLTYHFHNYTKLFTFKRNAILLYFLHLLFILLARRLLRIWFSHVIRVSKAFLPIVKLIPCEFIYRHNNDDEDDGCRNIDMWLKLFELNKNPAFLS